MKETKRNRGPDVFSERGNRGTDFIPMKRILKLRQRDKAYRTQREKWAKFRRYEYRNRTALLLIVRLYHPRTPYSSVLPAHNL